MWTRWILAGLVCLCLVARAIGDGAPPNHRQTEGGKPCHFPFTVGKKTYTDCTKYRWDHEWCATTPNFDKDKKWGNCKPRLSAAAGLAAGGGACVPPVNGVGILAFGGFSTDCTLWWDHCIFPFTYKGNTYYGCTGLDAQAPQTWCSLVDDWYAGQPWGACHDTGSRHDACTWIKVSGAVAAETNGHYYQLNDLCQNGYTVATWRKCTSTGSNAPRFVQLSSTTTHLRWTISKLKCRDPLVAYSKDYRLLSIPIPQQPYDPALAPWYEYSGTTETLNANLKIECLNLLQETCTCDRCTCTTVDSCQCTPGCNAGPTICTDSFTETMNMHSMGGLEYVGVTTRTLCESLCLANDTCMAFDFDTKCYFHIGMDFKNTQGSANGVNQYERVECTTTTGIPTGTTRPGGACTDSFDATADVHGFSGTPDPQADSVEKCKASCLAKPACSAFDYDIVSLDHCFLHLVPNVQTEATTSTGIITHYRKVKCTTTPAHPITTPGGCQDTFDQHTGVMSYDGTEITSATTVDACKQACRADDNCLGLDWNLVDSSCWLHFDPILFAVKQSSSSAIDQYVRKPCDVGTGVTQRTTGFPTGTGCVDTFYKLEKHNAPGGIRQNDVSTDYGCAAKCLSDVTCVAYDYNYVDDQCYLFFDMDIADKTQFNMDVHHYTRQPCAGGSTTTAPGGCQDEFKEYKRHQTQGGDEYTGTVSTLSDCLQACIQTECFGIDWDQQNPQQPSCWLHRSETNFLSRQSVTTNIDSYELIHRCQDTTYVTDFGTTTIGPTDCPNAWQLMPDTNVNGAEQYPAASTVETCQEACREHDDCTAIDFNKTPGATYRCWLHKKEISSNEYTSSPGVDHYKYIGCPSVTCIYNLYADTKVVGGTLLSYMSLQACQDACTADTSCLAIDYVPADSSCWIHSDPTKLPNQVNSLGVNHYVKECKEQCEDDFIGYENYNVQGGQQENGISDLAGCKAACSKNVACLGLDFNTLANSCWLHTDPAKIQTRQSAPNVNHYVIQRCDEGCQSDWDLFDNQNVAGGARAPGVDNLNDCKRTCEQMPGCLGIDYNVQSGSCWTHSDASKMPNRNHMNGVDHMVISRCSECINSYDKYDNMNVAGGIANQAYQSLDPCLNACYNDLTCLGIDFVRRAGTVVVRCWLHYPASQMGNRQYKEDVDHYVVKRCDEECSNQYTMTPGRHVPGGTGKSGVSTVAECQAACDAETSCTGFDFDNKLGSYTRCYLHYIPDPLTLPPMNGVDHYSLTNTCTDTTMTTPFGCQDEFLSTENTHSRGGSPTAAGLTLDLCKAACVSDARCMGLDWNPASQPKCWLHIDVIQTQMNYPGVTQYKIQRCSDCQDTFSPYPNMHASGGVHNPSGDTTVFQCQHLCSQDDLCVGLDYNAKLNAVQKCYLFANSVGELIGLEDVTHYKINRCTSDCTMVEYKNGWADSGDNVGFFQNNYDGCRMACETRTECKSVDWNKLSGACLIHTDSRAFIMDSCCKRMVKICGTCVDQFAEIPHHNVRGGIPTNTADELEECKQECRNSPNCEAFDFNTQHTAPQTKCYLHNQIVTSLLSNTAVSHYQRGFCLPPVGTSPTGVPTNPTGYATGYPLECVADIVFLIDDSGSIIDNLGNDNGNNKDTAIWEGVKNFLRTIAANIDIRPDSNRLAAVRFSNVGIVDFRFNQIQTNQVIDITLANLPFTGGATNTHYGIQAVLQQVLTVPGGDRPLVKNIVVIFTDGKSADSVSLSQQINALRSVAKVFVVGVTSRINHVGLLQLTSFPSENHLYFMSDLTTFVTSFTAAIKGSCQAEVSTTFATTSNPLLPLTFQCNAAFTVGRNSPAPPSFPLTFPVAMLNYGSLVAGGRFISPGDCIYYVTLCVGVPAHGGINYALIRPNGWPVFNAYRTSTAHSGIDMLSRDGLISINQNQPLSIKTTNGNVHSGVGMHTSWSAMSLTEASSVAQSYFYVTRISDFSNTENTVVFTEYDLRSTDNSFDRHNSRYRCPAEGFYFFSYSVGLKAGQGARVQLKGGSRTVELTRTSTSHNGYDTISRSVLLHCDVGSFVWLYLAEGVLASNTDHQISFLGFRYNPASGHSVAWSVYRTSSFSIGGAVTYLKISYTEVAINIGNAYDVGNHRVKVPRKGIYLIHWSVGVQAGNQVDVGLFKNGQPLAAIIREASNHNGRDTMGRTLVLEMQYNDLLEVRARISTAGLYSDLFRQISFIGFLLNPL